MENRGNVVEKDFNEKFISQPASNENAHLLQVKTSYQNIRSGV